MDGTGDEVCGKVEVDGNVEVDGIAVFLRRDLVRGGEGRVVGSIYLWGEYNK